MIPPRLAWALAISLALHLCLGWLFSPMPADSLLRSAKAVALTVALANKDRSEPLAVAELFSAPAPAAAAPAATASEAAGDLTQRARFLIAPDLSALEEIAVPYSGSLTLRLDVSALGTVDRVTVVESDPLPKELRDGLVASFAQSRLAPAMSGSKAVASTMDLVIRFEAAPAPLSRGAGEPAARGFARRAR